MPVSKYLDEGYARKITEPAELDHPKQCFLPHHGVYKKSAERKIFRIVFDATVGYNGRSLNNSMLTGPEGTTRNPMFRQRPIAFGADIEAMFSKIRLTKEDARHHRFLMTDPETGRVEVFQLDRLTFGDGASPFVVMATLH